MADNVAITAGSGTNIATDDIGGVQHQRVKVEFGADGSATDVSSAAPLPAAVYALSDGGFVPEPDAREGDVSLLAPGSVRMSSGGELVTRSTVSTDEGHFRHDFPGAALTATISGTNCTFTNASATVTGAGTSFLTTVYRGMYVKLNADAETAWAQVQSVESNTSLTLTAAYTGTGGTGASSSAYFRPFNAGSVTVGSSSVTLASGTTISQRTSVFRQIDCAPLRLTAYGVSLSQRIANQTAYLGLQDAETSPTNYARFEFTGTTNTTVNCVVSSDGGTNTSTSTVTLPNVGTTTTSGTTATAAVYEIEVTRERVVFLIDRVPVANFERHIPLPYPPLGFFAGWINAGSAPASTSSMLVDELFVRNTSIVQIARDFVGDPLPVEMRPGADMLVQAVNVVMTATNNVAVIELSGRASSLAVELTGTFTGTVTFEILMADQGVWTAHNVTVPSTGASVTTATAVGRWWAVVTGAKAFRVRSSTSGTGSVGVSMLTSAASSPVTILGVGTSAIGSVTVSATTALTPGTAAANLGKAEDAVAASGDTGVMMLGVLRATGPGALNNASATGDYTEIPVSSQNGQWVAPAPVQLRITSTPTISSGAIYASGDVVGAAQTFTGAALATGRGGQVVGATIIDKAKQKAALELWLFLVSPTLVGADNAAFDITDANLLTAVPIGIVSFPAARYADSASSSVCFGEALAGGLILIPYVTSGSANLFGALVSRGTPTYGSTTDLVIDLVVQQF